MEDQHIVTLALFVAGIALLIVGAEALVRGASRLAASLGISPLVVGLTVVAVGTSSPETAVTVQSAFTGNADIALGNVVGSNIMNVLFVLGVSAVLLPLSMSGRLVRLEVPFLILVSLLLSIFALDGKVGRLDGLLLVSGAAGYTVFAISQSRRESSPVRDAYQKEFSFSGNQILQDALVVVGLIMLVLGARGLVDGAIVIASMLGLSELIIGLTAVAFGTSLPEVATLVVAALRGQRDIAVGNIVGSTIFNILAVLGISGLVAPEGIGVPTAAVAFDIPVMIATAVACLPIFFTGRRISRLEGALFLAYYAAYTLYLFLDSSGHDALPFFNVVMLWFVIPITVVMLLASAVHSLKNARKRIDG